MKKVHAQKIQCAHDKVVPLVELVPNKRNPNIHPENQIEMLAKIMRWQGIRHPIVVSKRSGFIVKGHGRLEAAKLNGWETFPVDFQDYESEAQEYADMCADNKIAELSSSNMSMVFEDATRFKDDLPDFDMLGIPEFTIPTEVDGEMPGDLGPTEKPLTQMTFTLHLDQKEGVEFALSKIKKNEELCFDGNENSNGNAIHAICIQWAQQNT